MIMMMTTSKKKHVFMLIKRYNVMCIKKDLLTFSIHTYIVHCNIIENNKVNVIV